MALTLPGCLSVCLQLLFRNWMAWNDMVSNVHPESTLYTVLQLHRLYPAEITPLSIRAPANAISTTANWIFNVRGSSLPIHTLLT